MPYLSSFVQSTSLHRLTNLFLNVYSIVAMFPSARIRHHAQPVEPYHRGDGGHDGARHDVGPVPVGWQRGQLSHYPTLFRDGAAVGHVVLGVLSAPYISVRGGLPAGGR